MRRITLYLLPRSLNLNLVKIELENGETHYTADVRSSIHPQEQITICTSRRTLNNREFIKVTEEKDFFDKIEISVEKAYFEYNQHSISYTYISHPIFQFLKH